MDSRGFLFQNAFPLLSHSAKVAGRQLFRLTPRRTRAEPTRLISVIIPAHNEEAYLQRTLDALRRQNYGWFEIVVVANGCTDRTVELARGKCHRLIVLSQKSLGIARNLGARMARGELLMFLDADTILEPMALRRIAQDFGDRDAAGTLHGRPDSERLACRLIYGLKNFVHRWSLHSGSSGVILCWREHFLRAGGFDEGLEVRENSELLKRLKRYGRYRYIGDVTATTSMRRYEQRGVARVVWLWCKLWAQSLVGDLHNRCYETVR
ncbi:MAG TPA: glycosyltransferase [Candidatus Limnocylindrales bacterium]|nr:glycosyltransferase [Candidatus Limnocylindrales bacterium]